MFFEGNPLTTLAFASALAENKCKKDTVISFDNMEKEASYYTLNFNKRKELLELAEKYPEQVKIVSDNGEAIEALLPKGWIKIQPPRELTDK